jgi:S-adenosylmethionine:tRNA-ribosyltransferase-isomerase (queuine synthetase)
VSDLPGLLRAGDVLVFNDTRVIPAQLEGRRGEAGSARPCTKGSICAAGRLS